MPSLDELDLDAVTMAEQPRRPFGLVGGAHPLCDWAQSTDTVTIFMQLGAARRAKDLHVELKRACLRVSLRGKEATPLLCGAMGGECSIDESDWQVISGELVINLVKALRREWVVPVDASSTRTSAERISGELSNAVPAAASPKLTNVQAAPRPRPTPAAAGAPSGAGLGDRYEAWAQFD